MTLLAWQYSAHLDQLAAQQKFEIVAQSARQLLGRQIDTYLQTLFDMRGFLSADQSINRIEFETYARNIQLRQHYPGIHMLGYLPRVRQQEKNAFETQLHKEGFPQYRIRSARPQSEYFPEFYIYPGSVTLFGNNLHERADRGPIMDQVRDDNRALATAKTTLDIDPKKRAAFVVYLPVYHARMPLLTVAERRQALKGFVFETFIMGELVKAAIGALPGGQFKLDLIDGPAISTRNVMFDSDQLKDFDEILDKSRFKYITHLGVGGRNWTLAFHPSTAFYRANKSSTPSVVLYGGLLTSLLLAGITFQFNARRRLRWAKEEQDQRYRSLFDQHPDAVYSMDLDGNITSANTKAKSYAGLPLAALRNTSFTQFIAEEWRAHAMAWLRKAAGGVPASGETVAVGKDGQRFDLRVTNLPIVVDGRITGVFGIARDITRHKKAEAQLRATEERLNSILSSMDEVVWSTSLDGREALFLNQAAESLYGREKEEFFDNPGLWMTVVHPDDRALMQNFTSQVLDNGVDCREFRIVRADGEVRWVRARSKVIYNLEGQANRLDSLVTDITAQKLAEQALSKQKQLLEKIIDTLPLSIFIKDAAESRFLMVNSHAASTHAKTKNELVGQSMFDIYPEEIAEKLCLQDRQILISGGTVTFEERVIRNGRECHVLSGKAALNVEGEPPMLLGYTVDITERKQMEVALRQARDELEARVNERTTELSAANAQLKALSLHLQHIREEERSRVAREIHDELGGVLAMLKFELSTSVQTEQIAAIEKRHYAAAQVVDTAIQSLRRIMADLRPSVLDDIGLWAALEWQAQDFEERQAISCLFALEGQESDIDPDLGTALFRMVQGALNNVAKHANATDVLISATVDNDAITVVIEDNGIGISDEQLQEANALGLLGRKELAHAFGGDVQVFRNAVGGTTVEIRLPYKKK